MIGPFSGFFILSGIVAIAIGLVVRRFWPRKQGSITFLFFSFRTSKWFAIVFYGVFSIAIGIFLVWLNTVGAPGSAQL